MNFFKKSVLVALLRYWQMEANIRYYVNLSCYCWMKKINLVRTGRQKKCGSGSQVLSLRMRTQAAAQEPREQDSESSLLHLEAEAARPQSVTVGLTLFSLPRLCPSFLLQTEFQGSRDSIPVYHSAPGYTFS